MVLVEAVSSWICSCIDSDVVAKTSASHGLLSTSTLQLRGQSSVVSLAKLLIENSSLLVDLDHWSSSVVVDHSALLVMLLSSSLEQFLVARVLVRHLLLVANRDVWVNQGVLGAHVGMSIWIVRTFDVLHDELASFGFVVDILNSIILLVDVEGALSSWDFEDSFVISLSKSGILFEVDLLISEHLS